LFTIQEFPRDKALELLAFAARAVGIIARSDLLKTLG
jgi:hypothetical protein